MMNGSLGFFGRTYGWRLSFAVLSDFGEIEFLFGDPPSLSLNLNTRYGSFSSKLWGTRTSSTSGILCRAHLNLVFQVDGSGDSPGLYLPVCSAHSLNNIASFSILKSGLPACFHETRNSFFSLSRQHNPGIFSLFILSSNHGLSLCRTSDILLVIQPLGFLRFR